MLSGRVASPVGGENTGENRCHPFCDGLPSEIEDVCPPLSREIGAARFTRPSNRPSESSRSEIANALGNEPELFAFLSREFRAVTFRRLSHRPDESSRSDPLANVNRR